MMRGFKIGVLGLTIGLLVSLGALPAWAAEKPVYGGVMKVAIAGDPPSLDMHQEGTFKVMIPMGNCYNTLIKFDPHSGDGFKDIIPDLAKSWTRSADGNTITFKLHQGVKFHDGTEMTSADAKASWDKIVSPPKGTISTRRTTYQMIKSIEAPDRYTVVFKLHYPAASFIPLLALPYNFIYSKAILDKDPNWYKKNVMGTGPFKLKKLVRGSYLEVERNPNYWKKGLPYLDGIKYYMIKDLSARAKSVRTGRTDVELRGFPPAEVEVMQKEMGDKLVVRYPRINIQWGVSFNHTRKPFDDERVRQALSLAINRYEMAKVIGPLTGLNIVGGIFHPDTKWALSPEALQQFPGYGKDHAANIAEAKRLLAEAGYPNGFKTELHNRAIKLPYIDMGVYLISSWKKIGVEAEHNLEESATWSKNARNGNFHISVDPMGAAGDGDPDYQLQNWLTGGGGNGGKISNPEIDALFEKQKVELDEKKRIAIVQEIQKIILSKAHWMSGLWWTRIETRSARIKNYEPMHYHHMNRRMEDVWMTAK
ncbi:MAG: ABC transporter substrate-binding protein [Candidatus Tectomicrobia bacterium]